LTPGLDPPGSSAVSSVTCWEDVDWLEMTSVIGPAPNALGETDTASSLIDALMTIGTGGRSALVRFDSSEPQEVSTRAAVSAQAATAAWRGVLRCAGLWLLILDPDRSRPRGRATARREP